MADLEASLPAAVRALPRRGDVVPAYWLDTPQCDVLFVAAPAGAQLPLHEHDTNNATVVVSGESIVTVGGREHRYGPGEWYGTGPHEEHAVRFEVDTMQVELRFKRHQQ